MGVLVPATRELLVGHGVLLAVHDAAMPRHVQPLRHRQVSPAIHARPSVSSVGLTSKLQAVSD
jgi:hypothetical protein